MSSTIYCKYCHHNWKPGIEYEKHMRCCEYFYQQRRTPSQPEMDERGVPIPSLRQLYRYVQELSYRLEKTEKELKTLKNSVNSRQKRAITEWLKQPNQTPPITFEQWVRNIKAQESDMMKVLNGDLSQGILSCLENAFNTGSNRNSGDSGEDTCNKPLPIRCFSQKPGTFYIYCAKPVDASSSNASSENGNEWKIMNGEQALKLVNHISKSLLREFLIWDKAQSRLTTLEEGEFDHSAMDRTVKSVKKLNGDVEKRLPEIKKTLFSKLEENLRVVMDCEYE